MKNAADDSRWYYRQGTVEVFRRGRVEFHWHVHVADGANLSSQTLSGPETAIQQACMRSV